MTYSYDGMGNLTGVLPAKYQSATSYSTTTGSASVDYRYDSVTKRLDEIETDFVWSRRPLQGW